MADVSTCTSVGRLSAPNWYLPELELDSRDSQLLAGDVYYLATGIGTGHAGHFERAITRR